MKTTILKERIFKSSILFFSISAFILSALSFASCSDSLPSDLAVVDDTALITKIEMASKTVVVATSLPSATETTFRTELADSYIASVELAANLGYKVAIVTDNESREEKTSDVYFSMKGKQLVDTNTKRQKRRHKCFVFVYPIDFIMPDNTSITLTTKDDWSLIRAWYHENPDVKVRPELVFPVDITLKDGTTQTLIDREELRTVIDSCRRGNDKKKCFRLVFPVSFTMEDASVIEVTERKDFKLLREWHKANPDSTVKPALNFPVDIKYRDGTTATVNDKTEMKAAKDAC